MIFVSEDETEVTIGPFIFIRDKNGNIQIETSVEVLGWLEIHDNELWNEFVVAALENETEVF